MKNIAEIQFAENDLSQKFKETLCEERPILIEGGHHSVYLSGGDVKHGAIRVDEDQKITQIRGVSKSEIQSFCDGLNLAIFLERNDIRYQLFSSVSNIRGHSPEQRKEIAEITKQKSPIEFMPIEFQDRAYQIGSISQLGRSAINRILENIQILVQSEFGVMAVNKFKTIQNKVDAKKTPEDALRWHSNRYNETGQIFIDAYDEDEKYTFVSTPRTRQPFNWPSEKVFDFVKKVGSIPLTVNGVTRCGPIAAGMQVEMLKRAGISNDNGATVINFYSNDDNEIANKAQRGYECIDTLNINLNGKSVFLFQSQNNERAYNAIGLNEFKENANIMPFEEAVQISINRLYDHVGFPVVSLRNTITDEQKEHLIKSVNDNSNNERKFKCAGGSCSG